MTLRERILGALWSLGVSIRAHEWAADSFEALERAWLDSMPLGDRARANGAGRNVGTCGEVQAVCDDLPRLIDEMRFHEETADTLPAPDPNAWICLAGDAADSEPDAADWQTLHNDLEPGAMGDWATGKGWPS